MEFLPTHLVIDPIMDLFGLEKSCTEDDLDCQEADENSNDLQSDLGPINQSRRRLRYLKDANEDEFIGEESSD